MAARISTLLAEVEAALSLAFPALTYGFGERAKSATGLPPRITWVLGEETSGPPEKRGRTARSLATRNQAVAAVIWGASLEDAELLREAVHCAVHRAAYGSYECRGATWPQEDWVSSGVLCVVSFVFQFPVPDKAWALAPATTLVIEPGTAGDGVLETGES